MLSIFSFVNTLEKNSLRASDFSLGEVTFLPSGLLRDGIVYSSTSNLYTSKIILVLF